MALQPSDLLVIQQGNSVYKVTKSDLGTSILGQLVPSDLPVATDTTLGGIKVGNNLQIDTNTGVLEAVVPAAFVFKGQLAATANAPGSPSGGDFYLFSSGGTLNSTWGNLDGTNVAINDAVVWDADHGEWDYLAGLFSAGVTSVQGTAPITIGGDSANVVVGISPATTSDAGSFSSADKTKLDGITPNADIGTVTEVTASQPISVAQGTSTPVISVRTASAVEDGVVTIADATAVANGDNSKVVNASQLKATNDSVDALDTRILSIESAPKVDVLGGNSITVNETPAGTFTVSADPATKTMKGVVQLATDAEVEAGTDDTTAVTPKDAAAVYLPKDFTGLQPLTP